MKNFIEVNGSNHLNMIFNESIENVEQMKLKNKKQSDIKSFFRYVLFMLFTRIVWKKSFILIYVVFSCPKNPKLYIADTWL